MRALRDPDLALRGQLDAALNAVEEEICQVETACCPGAILCDFGIQKCQCAGHIGQRLFNLFAIQRSITARAAGSRGCNAPEL